MNSRSMVALRQAVDWASDQGMTIRDALSEAQLERLQRVFSGRAPWSFELYQPLRAFSHAVARLDLPDLPARVHFADALTAVEEVMSGEPWPTSLDVSPATFADLGYARISAGITRLKERFNAAWREHGVKNKNFLLRAAELSKGENAIVVGAGKIYDLPLRLLAERFQRLILVDIDLDAMQYSVENSGLSPELRERLLLVRADVTGINDVFMERSRTIFDRVSEDDVYSGVLELLHSYRLAAPPALAPIERVGRADSGFSSMVLSQLATPLTEYLEARYVGRFPGSQRWHQYEMQVALGQFTHRVQHAHLRALGRVSPLVAVSSDVAESAGVPEAAAVRLPLIGAPHLEELFTAADHQVVASNAWSWHRVPASKQPPGRHLEVHGVAVHWVDTGRPA